MDSISLSLSLSPPSRTKSEDWQLSQPHDAVFRHLSACIILFSSFLPTFPFLFAFAFTPLFPPSKRGLHALHYWTSILANAWPYTHATFSSAFLAEWSIFVKEGGREGDGAYNWVQSAVGPGRDGMLCIEGQFAGSPPSPGPQGEGNSSFVIMQLLRDPLSKVFEPVPFRGIVFSRLWRHFGARVPGTISGIEQLV